MIDTHVHLNDEIYNDNIECIIQNALNNNVKTLFIVGYDYKSSKRAIEIVHQYESLIDLYAIVGLHPSEVDKENDKELKWLINMLNDRKVIAIGEIGIDLYWSKEYKDLQVYYFSKQLEIAKQYNLPVSIHTRNAIELTYDVLKEHSNKGIIHCYSGSFEMANKFIKLGYYLGIGGVLTFKNCNLKDVIKLIDLQYIVMETDSPYLAPVPYRGKTNEPAFVKIVYEEVAKIKNISYQELVCKIRQNVKKMFCIRRDYEK